jgi:carboxymethylenebutenolidase
MTNRFGLRVIGKEVSIPTPDGTMDGYAAQPAGGGPFALVVMFMDVWGLREELFALARGVAEHGYYCLLPNLFYRDGKIRIERRNADGKMVSFDTLPAALQQEMRSHSSKIDRPRTRADIAAVLEFCRGEPVDPGPAGSVGFCLGGRAAFYAGQEFPDRFLANASLHGTHLVTDADDSPQRLAGRLCGEFYGGYGALDRLASPEIIAALDRAFAANPNIVYRRNLHAGAHHGYALPDRDIHDASATATDWREIFAMFGRRLSPSVLAKPGA